MLIDIPSDVLKAAQSRPENVEALRHPSWNEARFDARQLLPKFQEDMGRVDAFLNPEGGGTQT